MFDQLDVEDFLSHHGVKGMRWGVRNVNRNNRGSSVTNAHKAIRRKRILQGLAIGGAIATTAFVSSFLTKKGMTPIKLVNSSSTVSNIKLKAQVKAVDKGASMLKKILEKNATKNVSALPKVKLSDIPEFKMRQARLDWQKRL